MSRLPERLTHLTPLQRAVVALKELRSRLEAVEQSGLEPIAVVGAGCRLPGGVHDPEGFWRLLRDGVHAVRDVPGERWNAGALYDPDPDAAGRIISRCGAFLDDVDSFDAEFFGISSREAASLDPQQRLLLEVAWEALEHAGLAPERIAGTDAGVFLGIANTDYSRLVLGRDRWDQIDAYATSGSAFSIACGRLSYVLGLRGPCLPVDTACSSSLVAVHLACRSLRARECGVALAGGVNLILSPEVSMSFTKGRFLSRSGRCRAFDAAADGYVRGEGCVIFVLKRLSDALSDQDAIMTVLRGSAVNHGGRSTGLTVPVGASQEAVIRSALRDARLDPGAVGYIEAHSAGTALGDPIEVSALAAVFGQGEGGGRRLMIGSVKTNVGHLEAAAGATGLLKVILSLQHAEVPPHLHLEVPNPDIPWARLPFDVPVRRTPWPAGEIPRRAGVSSFGFGGTNAHVVVEEAPVQGGTERHQQRPRHLLAISAKDVSALRELAGRYRDHLIAHPEEDIGDLCATVNLGRSHFPHRAALEASSREELREKLEDLAEGRRPALAGTGAAPRVAFVFTGEAVGYEDLGREVAATDDRFRGWLEKADQDSHAGNGPAVAERASCRLFALQYALADLWQSWGITPDAVLGSGVGEVAAACVAGMFGFEDGLQLAAARSQRLEDRPDEWETALRHVDARVPRLPVVSCRSGRLVNDDEVRDGSWWRPESRESPVIHDALLTLKGLGCKLVVEVGPHPSSSEFASSHEPGGGMLWLSLLSPGRPEWDQILSTLGALYERGVSIDWAAFHRGGPRRRLRLPTYPFQRRRHWVKTSPPKGEPPRPAGGGGVGLYEMAWRPAPQLEAARPSAEPAGRWVILADGKGVGSSLASRLEATGAACTVVFRRGAGSGSGGTAGGEHLRRAIEQSRAGNLRGVVHLWSLDTVPPGEASDAIAAGPAGACGDVVSVLRALAGARLHRPPRLWLVTQGAQPVTGSNEVIAPEQAPIWGLGRTLALENPEFQCSLVDLDSHADTDAAAGFLHREACAAGREDQVASRGGLRFVPRIVSKGAVPAKAEELVPHLVGDATYLVTGGLGALGMQTARWLVDRGARHVVLAGRREPPAARQKDIADLRQRGAQVVVLNADVARRDDVIGILDSLRPLPPLKGIVHAAGILDDGPLLDQDPERLSAVMAPKATGAWNLHDLTRDRPLDFFVLFSSATALLGSTAQAGYVAANCFLGALAHHRRGQGLPAACLDWGPWAGAGMAGKQDAGTTKRWAARGLASLAPERALDALGHALMRGDVQVAVLQVDWKRLAQAETSLGSRPVLSEIMASPASHQTPPALLTRWDLAAPRDRPGLLAEWISAELAAVLERDPSWPVPANASFFDLGLDSLTSVELRNRLQAGLGTRCTLSSTVVFDHPTLESIGRHLSEEILAEAPAPLTSPPCPATPGEGALAIIGLACRFPGAADPEAFWRLLQAGVDAITEVPRDRWDIDAYFDPDPEAPGKMSTRHGGFLRDVDRFDPEFFGISPREAETLDPQHRLLLEVVWEALERSGQTPGRPAGRRTGVFIGIGSNDYLHLQLRSGRPVDAWWASGNAPSAAAGRLSYVLGLQGPSLVVDTACSSSLVAVHLAAQSLRARECDVAVAGGVNLTLLPELTMNLSRARMMAADGRCKAFDARADGYVRGEGCGIVVLKRLPDALSDGDAILAQVLDSAVNQDGRSGGLTIPNGLSQVAVIREALRRAGVEPDEVDYVEAHGTGTALGDPIEMNSLGAVFGPSRPADRPLLVGTVKTNIGHLEAAAGVAGLIKVVLALQHGEIPPHLHLNEINPHIPIDRIPVRIPTTATPWVPQNGRRVAGVSSFGFVGTNAHVVIAEAPPRSTARPDRDRPRHLFTLSAKSAGALSTLAARFQSHLAAAPSASLGDICYSVNAGRCHFDHRLAVSAGSLSELASHLSRVGDRPPAAGQWAATLRRSAPPLVAFGFTDEAASGMMMGRDLFPTQPVFRAALSRCDEVIRRRLGRSIVPFFDGAAGDPWPEEPLLAQPLCFAVEYALTELWRSFGVKPSLVLGLGIGEYVAACVAGVFGLEDGLTLVAERGRQVPGAFEQAARGVAYRPPELRFVSAETGVVFEEGAVPDAAYWARRERDRSLTSSGMAAPVSGGVEYLLEIGPRPAPAGDGERDGDIVRLPTVRPGSPEWELILENLGRLYVGGVDVDWEGFDRGFGRRKVALPTYPFERRRCWFEEAGVSDAGEPSVASRIWDAVMAAGQVSARGMRDNSHGR